jgi:hypothetical protein
MGVGHGYVPASFADTGQLDQAGNHPASFADTGQLDDSGGHTGFREGELSEYVPDSDLGDSYDLPLWRAGWREGRSRVSGRRRRPARDEREEREEA